MKKTKKPSRAVAEYLANNAKSCNDCDHRHLKQIEVKGGNFVEWKCRKNKPFGKICSEYLNDKQ